MGTCFSLGEFLKSRDIDGKIRRAVCEGNAFGDRGISVEHGRSDRRVVCFHRLFKRRQILVHVFGFQKHFRRGAPDHHEAVELVFLFEVANVVAKLFGEIELRLTLLDVCSVQIFYIGLIERSLHRLDVLQKLLRFGQIFRVEDTCFRGRLVGIIRKHIPSAENEIVEFRERHEGLNFWHAIVGALPEADGAHLRQRTNRHRLLAPHQFDTRHKCGADSPHARRQYSQFSFWRSNTHRPAHSASPPFFVEDLRCSDANERKP